MKRGGKRPKWHEGEEEADQAKGDHDRKMQKHLIKVCERANGDQDHGEGEGNGDAERVECEDHRDQQSHQYFHKHVCDAERGATVTAFPKLDSQPRMGIFWSQLSF